MSEPQDCSPARLVRLTTMDNVDFEVVPEVIFQSGLIKDLVSDFGDHNDNMSIPLHNIRSEILTKVIEFCERHRPDRPPLMKPYAPPPPPPPKPYWQMTPQEREIERLKALGLQPTVDPAPSVTVKLEQDEESERATASGSGSGNTYSVGGNEQVASTSQGNASVEGVTEQELGDGSKNGKEKEKAVVPIGEPEQEEPPAMVPMTLLEVGQADVNWNTEFVKVDQDMLFSLVLAANYLDVPALLYATVLGMLHVSAMNAERILDMIRELGCKTIGAEVAGKTPAQVRELYGIPPDYDVNNPPPSAPADGEDQGGQATSSATTKKSRPAKRGKKRTK